MKKTPKKKARKARKAARMKPPRIHCAFDVKKPLERWAEATDKKPELIG